MAATNDNRCFARCYDGLRKAFHFFIDSVDRMPVGLYLFFYVLRILINEILNIAKVEMPNQCYFFSYKEVITLNIEKCLEKGSPCRTRAAYAIICLYADVLGDAEDHILCRQCTYGVRNLIR